MPQAFRLSNGQGHRGDRYHGQDLTIAHQRRLYDRHCPCRQFAAGRCPFDCLGPRDAFTPRGAITPENTGRPLEAP